MLQIKILILNVVNIEIDFVVIENVLCENIDRFK